MLIYPAHALAPSFQHSLEPIGLFDTSRAELIYANDAFASHVERLQINRSKHWLHDWPQLQQAIQACAERDGLSVCEHADWGVRVELLAVQLQHADGSTQRVAQCKPVAVVEEQTANLLDWTLRVLRCSSCTPSARSRVWICPEMVVLARFKALAAPVKLPNSTMRQKARMASIRSIAMIVRKLVELERI